MSNEYLVKGSDLTSIADAIREKSGSSSSFVFPDGFVEAVEGLGSGIDTSDATVTAEEIVSGKTAYVNGEKIIGTMVDNGDITSTIDGIEAKSVTVPAGYTSGGIIGLDDTIDNEVATQADLIAQIFEVLASKAAYNTIYIGGSAPTADFGVNGDIYIVRSGS